MATMINAGINGRTYLITLPDELRNYVWSCSWGKIQRELRSLPSSVECIIINAEKLEWVDPFPFLSLLLSIAEQNYTKRISFVISNPERMSDDQKRVMEFLEKEGFLSALRELGVTIIDNSNVRAFIEGDELSHQTEHLIHTIQEQFNGLLLFDNCTILKAKIIDLAQFDGESEIDIMVEKELAQVDYRIRPHLPESMMNEILWKTGLFLKETINNVYEHAYEEKDHKYVGVYLRYRRGLMDNSLDSKSRETIDSLFNKESADVSCFTKRFPLGVISFFEAFVIDAGIGLTNHYTELKPEVKKSFREVWRVTIGLGDRASTIKKNTKFGGLYTLGRLLDNESLIARDYDFWIGDILPIVRENGSYFSSNLNQGSPATEGLAIMCRIAITKAMDNNGWILTENSGKCYVDALKEESGIYEKYFNSSFKQLKYPLSYIKDNRFDLNFLNGYNYLEQTNGVRYCFFLPSEHVSKNEVYNYIESLKSLVSVGNSSLSVIIADIPVNECGLYQFALENAVYKDDFTNVVDRIVLLSKRLSAYVLVKNKKEKTYKHSKTQTLHFIDNQPVGFAPHMSLYNCIEWLKTHDSMLVWQYIVKNNASFKYFVNREVTWYKGEEEKKLVGYLDFEKTLTNSFLKKVYKNALLRSLCLHPHDARCKYMADDPLMTGLADYMNTLYYNVPLATSKGSIALGSVYVSGATQSSDVAYNINVFLHKDSSQYIQSNTVMHLFAWPEKDLFPEETDFNVMPYRRVGATYAIAPYGWRYFPVPRYKAVNRKGEKSSANMFFLSSRELQDISFKSIYKCPPKETYDYWQGKNGLFMGISHVDYETKHDLLNINFPFIVKESFLLGGDLACFLLGEIAAILQLDVEKMDFHGNEKFKEDVQEYVAKKNKESKQHTCSLLVYPYHSHTERIMDTIKEYLGKDEFITAIPLIPINKERNGTSFQPSPLTIEMLRKTVEEMTGFGIGKTSEVNALFFDDAIVDGKTQEEIKHILYGLGIKHVVSLFLLERRRIPFNTSDDARSSVFWRLDIPRLGSKYNCPLCSALELISDFSSQLISVNACKRIQEWVDAWAARTESSLDRIQTIVPTTIQLDHPRKRFGIYFDEFGKCQQCGGDDNRIELHTSLGLTLYMGELLGMTSRDDKMLQYCNKRYDLDAFTLLEMLCTNLLLYGRTISRRVREAIVLNIFKKANSISVTNNHTALAALVLMTQERSVIICLKDEYEAMIRSNRRPNYDMLILLSYLGVHYPNDFDGYNDLVELRKVILTKREAYRLFHSEVYNGDGKTHNRPIGRLIDGAIGSTQDLRRVEDVLDCLLYSLDHIFDWQLSVWDENNTVSVEETKALIREKKQLFANLYWDGYESEKEKYIREMESLRERLYCMHQRFFIPLNLINENRAYRSDFVLFQRLNLMAEKKGFDLGFFNFVRFNVGKSHIYERWIIWDGYVDDEISFLIENAKANAVGPFSMDGKEDHMIWLSTEYNLANSMMSIVIYNKTSPDKNASFVREETSKKSRYGKVYLKEEMKVKVEYMDQKDNVIQTKIIFQLI